METNFYVVNSKFLSDFWYIGNESRSKLFDSLFSAIKVKVNSNEKIFHMAIKPF